VEQHFERLKSALADRYAIERELGAGGMATVYLARDLKHDRLVAVKVLNPELAASLGAERFLREVQVTAKLSHPHILPLYDSGEAGGFLYYVMPFVQGESLADLIAREKQLSIKDAVQIAREVAEALAQAHSLGLVHRDIKPHNVMMAGGHAIVADFGIASAVSQAGGEKLTQTGTTVGTPAYMSPEQGMGSDQLDGRSDIYSLGCVLFEMLVGQVPFTGTTPQQVIARHSMDHIPPPHIMRNTIPEELEEIVMRSMAKLPADRYRTAFEMAEALSAVNTATAVHRVSPTLEMRARRRRRKRILLPLGVAAGAAVVAGVAFALLNNRRSGPELPSLGLEPRRLAVLYFDPGRADSLAFVADALSEALIARLAGVPQLTVLSRDAVEPYRGAEVPRDSIARALGTGSLVTGSVEPAGERIRVTVRLVEGSSGSDIESRTFELAAGDLLAVRDSAAEVVSGFLRRRLGEAILLRERQRGTSVVEAWSLVQRAERDRKVATGLATSDRTRANRIYGEADSLLALAERADPRWAEAVVLRGWVAFDQSSLAGEPHAQAARLRSAIAEADRALEMEPQRPDALHLRGSARYRLWQLDVTPNPAEHAQLLSAAHADLDASVKADPTLAAAWYVLSNLAYDMKDNVAAAIAAERAYEADAFLRYQDDNLYQLFRVHYDLEQFPNAQRWCDEGERRFPADRRFVNCQLMMLITPWAQPDPARALALARRADSLTPASARPIAGRMARMFAAGALARAGLGDSARQLLVAARAGRDIDPEQQLAVREAVIRVVLGDLEEAVQLLKGYVVANPTHRFDISRDLHWWWRPLRDDAEFLQSVAAPRR
jgi:serine/threonine-protein kinase